jgi:outer membrane protein TolC
MAKFPLPFQYFAAIAATVLFPCALFPADAEAPSANLTLADVFRLVEKQNRTVLAGAESVKASEQAVREARSALLPQLGAYASQSRAKSMTDYGYPELTPFTANSFTGAFTARLSIFDADNIANYKASKLEASAARYVQETTLQDNYADAAQLYFLYQRNLSALKVIEESIELDNVLLDHAVERRKAEVATELDVTRARATLARDRQNLLVQKTVLEETRHSLLLAIGLEPDDAVSPIQITPREPELANIPPWSAVLEGRPEYKAAKDILARYKVDENAADWERFPSISAIGEYGHTSRLFGDDEGGAEWAVGINANIPVYQGGRIAAKKARAKAMIRRQEQLVAQISDNVRSSLDLAVDTVKKRWDEIPFAQESVRLAQLELKYSQERFEAGSSDNSDVVTAQVALAGAKDSLVDAQYRYELARIGLARVLGGVQSRLSE